MISDLPESEIKITHSSYTEKNIHESGANYYKQNKNSQSDKWAKSQCLLLFSMRSPYLIVHGTHIVNIVFKFIVHSWFNAYNTQDLQLKFIHYSPHRKRQIYQNWAWFANVRYFIVMFIRHYVFTTIEFSSTSLSAFFYSPLTKKSKVSNETFEPPQNLI